MNNTAKIIVAIVGVAAVAGAVFFFAGGKPAYNKGTGTSQGTSSTDTASTDDQQDDQQLAATIAYNGSGFSPAEVTVKSGASIKIVNDSDQAVKPSSDPHPVHTDNPELNIGDIEPGESRTFTVTAKGTWGYHNHHQQTEHATITVE